MTEVTEVEPEPVKRVECGRVTMECRRLVISWMMRPAGQALSGLAVLSLCALAMAQRPAESAPSNNENQVKRILEQRQAVPLTTSIVQTNYRTPLAPVPRPILRGPGRLEISPDGTRKELVIAAEGTQPAVRVIVLPSDALTQMEQTIQDDPAAEFRVKGETFQYRRKWYLLPGHVVIQRSAARLSTEPIAETAPASTPSSVSEEVPAETVPKPGSPEAVVAQMVAQQPGRPMLTPAEQTEPANPVASVAPLGETVLPSPAGNMIIDRVVRVGADPRTGDWIVMFIGDNTLREPPARLLPCELLEKAEQIMGGPRRPNGPEERISVEFRISGEMVQYKGDRYLLLRKLVVQREMDQL